MAGEDRQDLKEIKEKIEQLESRLKILVENINENINIAKLLQKKIIPNRLQNVPGMKAIGRFIPGEEISAEGYDLFTDKDNRQLYFAYYWTQTFGLSSVLLQSLIHLQIRTQQRSLEVAKDLNTIFQEFLKEISDYKSGLNFRVLLAKVDLFSLKAQFMSLGMPPLLCRNYLERDSQWEVLAPEHYSNFSGALTMGSTGSEPENCISYEEQLKPGYRLFFVSPNWNLKAENADSFFEPLELNQSMRNFDLLDDLNHILVQIDQNQNKLRKRSDVSALALEIDAKKIHIA